VPDEGYLVTDQSGGAVAQILTNGNGTWRVEISNDLTNFKTYSSSVTVNDGQWHHLAYTFDATGNGTLKLYVDGVEDTSVTKTLDANLPSFSLTDELHMGVERGGNNFVDARIDEVRVWSDVRTSQEIQANYQNQTTGTIPTQLRAYYRFDDEQTDGKVQNLGSDGNTLDATITEARVINGFNKTLSLDGNDQAITANTVTLASHSVEGWVKTTQSGSVRGIFGLDDSGGAISQVIMAADGTVQVEITRDTSNLSGTSKFYKSSIAINDGQWHHIAYVVNTAADSLTLFIDGVAVTAVTKTYDASICFTITDEIHIGVERGAGANLTGQIADVRVWNTARTDAEIAENYNNPVAASQHSDLVSHYTFDEISGGVIVDEAGANNATISGATIVDAAPTVYGTEVTIQENEAVTGTMATNDVAGTATYSVQTAATKGTVIVDSTSGEWTYVPDVNYRGTDTFTLRATGATRGTDDETITVTVNAVNNDSINVHDGMVQFDGSNDAMRARIGTNTISDQLTMELWVNFLDLTSQQNPMRLGDARTEDNRIVLEKGTGNNFSVFMGNNTTNTTVGSNFVVSADTWYHVAVTYDGTTAKIYVNGNLVKSQAVSGVSLANTVQEVTVGADSFGFFSKALVDDVRVWNTARTAQEIRDNYDQQLTGSETNLQGYWRFDDDTSGTTIDDKTSNNRDGDLIESRYVLDMTNPGSDGVATGMGVASVNNFPTERVTVEMWVSPDALNAALFSYSVTGSDNHLIFEVTSAGDLSVRRDATTVTITGVNIVVGAWTHISVVWDAAADTVTVYQDGAAAGSTTLAGGALTTGGTIWLGNDQDSVGGGFQQNAAYDGKISEVRVWNEARSATDIAADYNQQLTGTEENLVGYWRLDESSGTTATDQTGNNNGTYETTSTGHIVRTPPILAPDGPKLINNLGHALDFDGTDDVLEIVDTDTFDTASYTIETWVKLDAVASRTILGRTDSDGLSGTQFSHSLRTDASGKFYHYTHDGTG